MDFVGQSSFKDKNDFRANDAVDSIDDLFDDRELAINKILSKSLVCNAKNIQSFF